MHSKDTGKFYIEHHRGLTDDLNQISTGLLRAKWFFLGTIVAIGVAYGNIYTSDICPFQKFWAMWTVCLVGNIVFWLVTEYALSHAFLFRFIQSQLAKIEIMFSVPGYDAKIKDPTTPENFIKNDQLRVDQIIPDQFVPIYWASTWLILINSVVGYLAATSFKPLDYSSTMIQWLYLTVGFPLIWKLWTYYGYKIDKYLDEQCQLRFVAEESGLLQKNRHYFLFPTAPSLIFLAMGMAVIVFCRTFNIGTIDRHIVAFWALASYFFPIVLGVLIHLCHVILRWNLHERCCLKKAFAPEVTGGERGRDGKREYQVKQYRWLRLLTLLYCMF